MIGTNAFRLSFGPVVELEEALKMIYAYEKDKVIVFEKSLVPRTISTDRWTVAANWTVQP